MEVKLSNRSSRLLIYILEQTKAITIQKLSEQFNVSVRTIKYDLSNIRDWLDDKQVVLHSRRNLGLWFELTQKEKQQLKSELLEKEKFNNIDVPTLRLAKEIFFLAIRGEAVNSNELSSEFEVNKNTILKDLDQLSTWLKDKEVMLDRLGVKGFSLSGEERDIRKMLEDLIQRHLTEYETYNIVSDILYNEKTEKSAKTYIGLNGKFQKIVSEVVCNMNKLLAKNSDITVSQSELLNFCIWLSLSLARISTNHSIGSFKLYSQNKFDNHNLKNSNKIIETMFEKYGLPVLEDEIYYIFSDYIKDISEIDLPNVTKYLIEDVSDLMNENFNDDQILYTNLFSHLSVRISNTNLTLNEYNPYSVDIKIKYPKLFKAVKDACTNRMKCVSLLINDSFITYIVLHFLVSIERDKNKPEINAVYVCSTGLGVTNLIEQRLSEELPYLKIVSFSSLVGLKEVIGKTNPDLVISIFPIEGVDVPTIKVNPLPSSEDIGNIKTMIKQVTKNKQETNNIHLVARNSSDDRLMTEDTSQEIILKGYVIYEGLLEKFENSIGLDYRKSFLLHVLLMVHRIYFDKQYKEVSVNYSSLKSRYINEYKFINNFFEENKINVNESEVMSLLQYFDFEAEKKEHKKMYESQSATEIINQSQNKEILTSILENISKDINEHKIVPTNLQWTILVNHVNEMIKRSISGETIPEVDKTMFDEVSTEAMSISKNVVESIGNLSESEIYVLSIHFETAKNN